MDPDGREIDAPDIEDRARLLKIINLVSPDKYNFNENGNLYLEKKNGNFWGLFGSKSFSEALQKGIESDKRIFLSITDTTMGMTTDGKLDTNVSVDAGGGGRTSVVAGMIFLAISGRNSPKDIERADGTKSKYNPIEIFIHELVGHAIPYALNQDGNAVQKENLVRSELNWKRRNPDETHICR